MEEVNKLLTEIPLELNEQERVELDEGQKLFETVNTPGFAIFRKKFEDLAYHSWIDPREAPSKEEWEWRELNGFHAANNAKEILNWIDAMVSRSEYLQKKKMGEVTVKPMKIG